MEKLNGDLYIINTGNIMKTKPCAYFIEYILYFAMKSYKNNKCISH